MNLLSTVQEQLNSLAIVYAAMKLENILEKAQKEEWTPLQTLKELLEVEQNGRQDRGRLRWLRLQTCRI